MENTDREIALACDEPHQAHQALIDAAQRIVAAAVEDGATLEKLSAMLAGGARVTVTVVLPTCDARLTLHRADGSVDVLATIRCESGRIQ